MIEKLKKQLRGGEFVFLVFLAMVSSFTTYLGLRESIQEGILAAGFTSELLALSLGLGVFVIIVFMWRHLEKIVRRGQARSALALTLLWLSILFMASTWWSAVGISGGTAMRAELSEIEKTWRDQIDQVFEERSGQVRTALASAEATSGVIAAFAQGEESGMITGLRGRGPVVRCYERMSSGLEGLKKSFQRKLADMAGAHRSVAALVDEIASAGQSELSTRELIAAYRTGGARLQSAMAEKAAVGDLRRSVRATLDLIQCPEAANLRPQQRKALADISRRLAKLTFTENGNGDEKFILPEPAPVHQAIFTHWDQVVPGWGAALAFDLLPLFLLLFGWVAYGRGKEELEELEWRLEVLRQQVEEEGRFAPETRRMLEAELARQSEIRQKALEKVQQLEAELRTAAPQAEQLQAAEQLNRLLGEQARREQTENASLRARLAILNQRAESGESRLKALQEERDRLLGEQAAHEAATEELRTALASLKAEKSKALQLFEAEAAKVRCLGSQLQALEVKLAEEDSLTEELSEQVRRLEEERGKLNGLLGVLQKKNEGQAGTLASLEQKLRLTDEALRQTKLERDKLHSDNNQLLEESRTLRQKLERAEHLAGVLSAQFGGVAAEPAPADANQGLLPGEPIGHSEE